MAVLIIQIRFLGHYHLSPLYICKIQEKQALISTSCGKVSIVCEMCGLSQLYSQLDSKTLIWS